MMIKKADLGSVWLGVCGQSEQWTDPGYLLMHVSTGGGFISILSLQDRCKGSPYTKQAKVGAIHVSPTWLWPTGVPRTNVGDVPGPYVDGA